MGSAAPWTRGRNALVPGTLLASAQMVDALGEDRRKQRAHTNHRHTRAHRFRDTADRTHACHKAAHPATQQRGEATGRQMAHRPPRPPCQTAGPEPLGLTGHRRPTGREGSRPNALRCSNDECIEDARPQVRKSDRTKRSDRMARAMLPDGATAPASTKNTHRPASPRRAHQNVTAVGRKKIHGSPGRHGDWHLRPGSLRRTPLPRNPLVEAFALMPSEAALSSPGAASLAQTSALSSARGTV